MRQANGFVVLLLVACILAPSVNAQNADKKPWEWTVEERIAARCDRDAARARIEKARAAKLAPTVSRNGHSTWLEVGDVILGRRDPHLFMPTELFESVVLRGFVFEGGRESVGGSLAKYGLPPDFWQQLEQAVPLYIQGLREEYRLAGLADQEQSHRLRRSMQPTLCRDRADALQNARALFGTRLDEFMYDVIAPTRSVDITHIENPADLKSRERGCR